MLKARYMLSLALMGACLVSATPGFANDHKAMKPMRAEGKAMHEHMETILRDLRDDQMRLRGNLDAKLDQDLTALQAAHEDMRGMHHKMKQEMRGKYHKGQHAQQLRMAPTSSGGLDKIPAMQENTPRSTGNSPGATTAPN